MAVQSPHHADNLLPDLLRRVGSAETKRVQSSNVTKGQAFVEDLPSSPWLHVFQPPRAECQHPPVKSKGVNGNEATGKVNRVKRTWEAACARADKPSAVKDNASNVLPFNKAPVFMGLRLATSSPLLDSSGLPEPSTSGFHAHDLSAPIRACMDKHANDITLLIEAQANAMTKAMEEKRTMHTKAVCSLIEEHFVECLNKKDEELEKVKKRTKELEEGLKQMSLELQLWKNLAKNNELMALNLKQNLEQAVAQIREQKHQFSQAYQHMSREEGCGESEIDDAVSSCGHAHAREGPILIREVMDGKEEQRRCKFCRVNEACVLLLPCRHLCLCLDCAGQLDKCPLCGITKSARLQVYT